MGEIDTLQTVETPEGISFYLHPAGPVPRLQAATIDLFIRGVLFIVVSLSFSLLGAFGQGMVLISFFTINWGYPIYFEMYHRGMTPGKQVFDIQVRSADGTPIHWRGSILRNLLRVADFLPFGYAFGIVTMGGTERFQRLGDLAADTVVCYRQRDELPDPDELPEADRVSPRRSLTLEEQAAIVRFAVRSRDWNAERSRELAAIVEPLTGESDAGDGVEHLRGLANGIVHGS